MDFIRKYDIELEKEHYYAGETLRGRVVIENVENLRVTCVQLFLRGKAHVEWRITRGGERRTVKEDQYFIDEKLVVWGTDNGGEGVISILPRGDHRFPFEFQLPASCLPCSFESRIGTVRYYLRVIIDIPYASPPQGLKYFTVIGPYLDCMDERYRTPLSATKQTTTKCLCCVSGPVGLEAWLEQSAYCCGEHIKVKCEVQNGSDQDVSLFCRLVQMVEFRINKGAFGLNKDVSHQVLDFHSQPVPAHSTKNFHDLYGDLRVPVMPPTMEDVCRVIEINYALRIGVHLEKSGDDLQIEFPFVVATVPHRLTSGHLPELSYEPADEHVEGGIYISPEFQLGQVYDGAADHVEEVILYRPVYVCVVRHGTEVVSNGHSPSSQLATDRMDGLDAVEATCSGSTSSDGRPAAAQPAIGPADGQRPGGQSSRAAGRDGSVGEARKGDGLQGAQQQSARKDLRQSPKRLSKGVSAEDPGLRTSGAESGGQRRSRDASCAEEVDDDVQRRTTSEALTSVVVKMSTSTTSSTMTSSTMASTALRQRQSSELSDASKSTTTSVEQHRNILSHQHLHHHHHHHPTTATAAAAAASDKAVNVTGGGGTGQRLETTGRPTAKTTSGSVGEQAGSSPATLAPSVGTVTGSSSSESRMVIVERCHQPQETPPPASSASLTKDRNPPTSFQDKQKHEVPSTGGSKQQPTDRDTTPATHPNASDAEAKMQREGKDGTFAEAKTSSRDGLATKDKAPHTTGSAEIRTVTTKDTQAKCSADFKNSVEEQRKEKLWDAKSSLSKTPSEVVQAPTQTRSTIQTETASESEAVDKSRTQTIITETTRSHVETISKTSKDKRPLVEETGKDGAVETKGSSADIPKEAKLSAQKSTADEKIHSIKSSEEVIKSTKAATDSKTTSGSVESDRKNTASVSVSGPKTFSEATEKSIRALTDVSSSSVESQTRQKSIDSRVTESGDEAKCRSQLQTSRETNTSRSTTKETKSKLEQNIQPNL